MGLIAGLIAGAGASLIGNSKAKKSLLFTIRIVEKHRKYIESEGEKNEELENFIKKYKKWYYKNLKKI